MKLIHVLGIYLNDEPGDSEALALAGIIARMSTPDTIACMHVRGIEDPAASSAPADADIRVQVEQAVPEGLRDKVQIHVSKATGLKEMIQTAKTRDLDMLVVGRRLPHDQMGRKEAFYRLARKAPCHVFVVPAGARAQLKRLQVVLDGSEHSKMALDMAIALSRASENRPHILVHSIYSVPYGSHYAGMTLEEAGRHFEKLARSQTEELLGGIPHEDVTLEVVYTCSQDPAAAALDLASANNTDAILLGSQGATLPANALLGSSTEKILRDASVPVLVVKRKGETFRFLDALLAQFK